MGGTVTKSLYLQIGGDVTALNTAAKAGKSVLASLGDAAVDVEAEVKRAFADFGSSIPDQAKRIERSFNDTFAAIRRNAQAVLDAPNGHAAVQTLNAGAANEAAAAAEKQAVALRQVATAASTVADRAGAAGSAERILAVASAAAAERAEQEATALRQQAQLLGVVDAEIRASAGGVVDASNVVVNAHQRMGASGAILQHVVRSTTDSFAAGLPVSIIFAEQIGRLAEASALSAQAGEEATGIFGKFGAVMAGPWGLAITVGISLAAQLVSHLIQAKDSVESETEKLKENADQARLASEAKEAFRHTEAGAIDDVRQLTEELKKQNDALRSNAELSNIRAKTDLAQLQTSRAAVAKQLSDARAAAATIAAHPGGGQAGTNSYGADEAAQKVSALEQQLRDIDQSIADAAAARLASQRDLAAEAAKRAADPLEAIKRKYEGPEGLIELAKRQASAEEVTNGTLTRRLFLLNQQEQAATKAEQQRQSAAHRTPNNDLIGVDASVADATRIIESIGGRVTSGYRSHDKQEQLYADKLAGRHDGPVAKPGTSDHERGKAIDVAYGPGISPASIKEAFRKAGVTINVLLDEPGQRAYHVGFGKKGPSAETLARNAQAATTRGANDDRAFTNTDRQIDADISRAKQQLSSSIEDDYQLKLDQIDADTAAKKRANADEVTANRLGDDQRKILDRKQDELALLDKQLAAEQRRVALADAAFRVESDASAGRLALLQLNASLAGTRRQRVAAERQILDEEQQQARRAAQHAVDVAPKGSTERAVAQADLDRLPGLQAKQDKEFEQQNLDPLASYGKQLYANVHDMNDALKGVEADGLKGLEDGLLGLIDGTETVAGAFKKMASAIIADLARIAIEKAILSFIGFKDGGVVGSTTPEKHAAGGFISGKGSGTSDDILSWLSNGEFVVRAAPTRKHLPLLKAINDDKLPGFATGGLVGGMPNLPTSYPSLPRPEQLRSNPHVAVTTKVQIEPSPLFEVQSRTIAQQTVGAAAQPIMLGATTQTMKKLRRPTLPGGYA